MNNFYRASFRVYAGICAFILLFTFAVHAQSTNQPALVGPTLPERSVQREQLTFGLDRIPQLRELVFGIPAWQYLATAIYIVLAIVVARFLDYLVTVQLRKLAGRTKTRLDDILVELLHGPVKILSFVVLLHLGLNWFHWPAWLELWLSKSFTIVLAISFTYMSLKMVDLGARFWRTRPAALVDRSFNDLLMPLVSKSIKAFIIVMAVLLTLDNLNFNIRTLLAGVSISGLALGLAAQDTVGNLFGAAAVFVDKPFKIGDRIQLNGIDGVVEEMGLRSTRVRNLDGHLITIPNKTMGNATITNVTRRPNIKTVLNFGLTYDTPAEKVAEAVSILENVFKKHPTTADLTIGFNQFGDSALNINVVHFWKEFDNKAYVAGMQAMNLEIKKRFDEAKINFAFPSRTVYLRQENEWQVKQLT
jgi:MscS family membrane protein